MTLERLFIVGLVVWRISNLLVNEEGPFDIFVLLRRIVGVRYDEYSVAYGKNVVARALTCVWCTSFWVSLVCCPLVFIGISANIPDIILAVLALNSIAILINEFVSWLMRK